MTGLIASTVGVPDASISAAVLSFHSRAGNGASVWVFQGAALSGPDMATRWASADNHCGGATSSTTLAGQAAVVFHRLVADWCEPGYAVALDDRTAAVIIDDGGYQGNAAYATPVPFRPTSEIAELVVWLRANLASTPLQTGGTMPSNG